MEGIDRILVFLRSNNDTDNIAPIIYKLGESTSIPVEIITHKDKVINDFRIDFLIQYDNVVLNLVDYSSGSVKSTFVDRINSTSTTRNGPNSSLKREIIKNLKFVGESIPINLPEKIYANAFNETSPDKAQNVLSQIVNESEDVLLVFDYLPGEGKYLYEAYMKIIAEARKNNFTTIAVPHGGSTFQNYLINIERLEKKVRKGAFESTELTIPELYSHKYERMNSLDYVTIPNRSFVKRFDSFMSEDRIKLTGYARYCPEWVDVLQEISPTDSQFSNSRNIKLVLFLGRENCYLSKREVLLTINLVSSLPNITLAIKNHPREKFVSEDDNLMNDDSVFFADDIKSPHLLNWGDIFLNAGTSVTIDCVMREMPMLDLNYLHANHTQIAEHLPECCIDTYDDLYFVLSNLINKEEFNGFYSKSNRDQYIEKFITSGYDNVLERHMAVFSSITS